MAIRITLECGHTSELRAQRTAEGYTHDWQVFVRGVDNAEIHQYIEKVVFHLHETFPKPKRVVKEPPYVVKESGYAGFEIPIYVYLKNKDEPKKFHFSYDLNLQPSGPAINKVVLHNENIPNPNDEFRKKLLKGGAVMVTNTEGTPEKSKAAPLMVGKPKLSGTEGKKYRMSEPKGSNAFADLFGPPIKTAGTKVSPDTKKPSSSSSSSEKTSSTKLSSSEKTEKSDKSSKAKHSPHKDGKKEKSSDERKEKKDKDSSKEKEKSKEKSKKSQSPINKSSHTSPGTKRPASPSPIKKPSTPPPSQPSKRPPSPKPREKESKKVTQEKDKEKEKEKVKESFKNTSDDSRTEKKKDKKKHKEDKEKEKKDKHKDRERDKSKDSKESKSVEKKVEKTEKVDKIEKEKPPELKQSKEGRKSPKPVKEIEKVKDEKPPKLEKIEKTEKVEKSKDSKDKDKHKSKHKKREKKDKRDGSKEREKKEKRDKNKSTSEKQNNAPVPPVTTNPLSTLLAEMPDRDSSDSAPSLDDEPITEPKPVATVKKDPPILTPTVSNESKPIMSPPPVTDKKSRSDRTKREKSKGNREEKETKKRKRRSESKGDDERAIKKERDQSASPLVEPVSSSQSPIAVDMENVHQKIKEEGASRKQTTGKGSEGEGEQVAPDSTNSTLVEPEASDTSSFSQEYVSQLKDLQHKIMTIEDNQELQRLVEVIAETGQYEVTKKTFDFDLCALDRRTVQRLQQFFAS